MLDQTAATANSVTNREPAGGIEMRRYPRYPVSWPAIIVPSGNPGFQATVLDASQGGFGLTGPIANVAPGTLLTIEFDQIGSFRCRLVWTNDTRFGVEIVEAEPDGEALDSASLKDMLRSLKSRGSR